MNPEQDAIQDPEGNPAVGSTPREPFSELFSRVFVATMLTLLCSPILMSAAFMVVHVLTSFDWKNAGPVVQRLLESGFFYFFAALMAIFCAALTLHLFFRLRLNWLKTILCAVMVGGMLLVAILLLMNVGILYFLLALLPVCLATFGVVLPVFWFFRPRLTWMNATVTSGLAGILLLLILLVCLQGFDQFRYSFGPIFPSLTLIGGSYGISFGIIYKWLTEYTTAQKNLPPGPQNQ